MIESPVIMTITISRKMSPRAPIELINYKQIIVGNRMTKSVGAVTFKVEFLYPEIFGQFSSMRAGVDIMVPADTENMKDVGDLSSVMDPYKDMASEYVITAINEGFRNVGKPEPFKG